MGQLCSKTQGQQQRAAEPRESQESEADTTEVQAFPSRRALDHDTKKPLTAVEAAKAEEDPGLRGFRPSVDEGTCTALLALRMGRGSSIGGDPRESEGSGSAMVGLESVPEDIVWGKDGAARTAGGEQQEGAGGGTEGSSSAKADRDSDRLEKLFLAPGAAVASSSGVAPVVVGHS